jgi:hypothetical protein
MWYFKFLGCCWCPAQNCGSSLELTLLENIWLTADRARWLLPGLEVLWGICTFAQSRVTNVNQIYALRFLVGMLEAPVFAGTHFILGIFSPSHSTSIWTCWLIFLKVPGILDQSCSSELAPGLSVTL